MVHFGAMLVAASVLMADPQFEAAGKQIKVLEPLIGQWFWDEWTAPQDYPSIKVTKGEKLKRIQSFEWDLANSLVVWEVRLEGVGKRIVVAKSLSGWDPVSGKIVGMGFWAGPFGTWYSGRHEWSANGNSLTWKGKGSKDKDASEMEQHFAFEGKDVMIIKTVSDLTNGQPSEDVGPVQLTRVK